MKAKCGALPDGKFYDLGSVEAIQGVGKGVIGAALLHPFQECIGIELLPELYKLSTRLKEVYQSHPSSPQVPVSFLEGDIFATDWSDASMILVNSTCFYTEMLERVSNAPVRTGCIAISLTMQLSTLAWDLLQTSKHKMSWGTATIHVQRKVGLEEQQRRTQEIGLLLNS